MTDRLFSPAPVPALLAATAVLLPLLASPATATVLVVPDDVADLQQAVDLAPAGGVVVVRGGVHEAVRVTRPITLLGDPGDVPLLHPSLPGNERVPGIQDPALEIVGDGAGSVTLGHLELGGTTSGLWYAQAAPAVAASSLEVLLVERCEVAAPDWTTPTGTGLAADALVALDVGLVVLSQSSVRGGRGTTDAWPGLPDLVPPGGAGVRATGTDVVVLDGAVAGGDGLDVSETTGPASCSDVTGGEGGDAVVAASLRHVGAELAGGAGASVATSSWSCTRPAGAAAVAALVEELPDDLADPGVMLAGASWELGVPPGSPGLLVVGPGPRPPAVFGDKGALYLEPGTLVALPVAAGASVALVAPSDAGLVGVSFAAQLYRPGPGLGRPVVGTVVP